MKNHTSIRLINFLSSFLIIAGMGLIWSPHTFAIGVSADAGLNASTAYLDNILTNSLIPVVLICGCVGGAAISFMKSSPTPFIVALIITVCFGFAKAWIGGTYGVCV